MIVIRWLLTETFVGPVACIAAGCILAWASVRSFLRAVNAEDSEPAEPVAPQADAATCPPKPIVRRFTRTRRNRDYMDAELRELINDYYAQPVTADEADRDWKGGAQ